MNQSELSALLQGGYDLHIHPIPSHVPRSLDDFEAVSQATKVGMSGILLKNHYESTVGRAALVNYRSPANATKAIGAVVLNHPVGGLNPYAVHSALKMGGKVVFMPTRDAENCLKFGDMAGDFFKREGISILNEKGALKTEVYEIMEIVKEYNGVLATGHISPEESRLLCLEGVARGVTMVLTHPEWERTTVDQNVQVELAKKGVFIEKCWYNIAEQNTTLEEITANIRAVGVEHCFLSTDRGQEGKESPVEAMKIFLNQLESAGISQSSLKIMVQDTAKSFL